MAKYGITRNRLYKVITGTTRPGGSQYQQGLKREAKDKSADTMSGEATMKPEAKLEQDPDMPPTKGKGKCRGKSSKKSRTSRVPHLHKTQNPSPFQDYQILPK